MSSREKRSVACQKPKVVILGAGPAGISAAWRLPSWAIPVTVLERDNAVGGMGRTIKVGDYSVDFGPHTFHIRETAESKEILKTITPFFGEDPLMLMRGTRVLLRGKEYVYPLEMLQVLFGVSPLLSARIVFDYLHGDAQVVVRAGARRKTRSKSGASAISAARSTTCASASIPRACGACRPARSRRSRRSASPS